MTTWAGYRWLLDRYAVRLVQPLRWQSEIGKTRQSRQVDGFCTEIYPPRYQPAPTFDAHMTFALKYEGVNFEAMARLLAVVPHQELVEWLNRERGAYARRTAFFWEFFNARHLPDMEPIAAGNYVNAIDPQMQLVATVTENNTRWRVRDNLPGTRDFCPLIVRTERIQAAENYDCAAQLDTLNIEFGADVLLRSAVWLTIKESRSSFLIEREERKSDDIKRFAIAMERYCGTGEIPLSEEPLATLQKEIIGENTTLTHFGLRKSPVFVGSVAHYENIVHYMAPRWEAVPDMMQGVRAFLSRTEGASSVVRAAAAAFGFVYVHPLADGNGRVHRFLINDILRRDGAVPSPYILPISATITQSPAQRAKYDEVLDIFSKPFMQAFSAACDFSGVRRTYEDGISSDLQFSGYEEAAPAWRYPDLTDHVVYLSDIIDRTIRHEMTNEARYIRDWERARAAVKKVIDGPDIDIDRIIRSVRENQGNISNALRKQFAVLEQQAVVDEVVGAIKAVYGEDDRAEN